MTMVPTSWKLTNLQNQPRNPFQTGAPQQLGQSQAPVPEIAPDWIPGQTTSPNVSDFDEWIKKNPGSADGWSYLQSLLNEYGLGDLSTFAQDALIDGLSSTEIVQRLRTTETYKTRFSAIDRRREAGLPAISEAEVIAYERQATQLMRAAGLPSGFWDQPEDFVKLQVSDVSLAELESRINQGYVKAMRAPQDVRDEWFNMYGLSEGDLAAFMLDPDRTEAVLQEQIGAVAKGAVARRTGFGALSRDEAEQLQRLGVSDEQAGQGFNDLTTQRQLMTSLPGEAGDNISREQQFAAVFGNDAQQQQRIQEQQRKRLAVFGGGTAFSTSQDRTGIGAAR